MNLSYERHENPQNNLIESQSDMNIIYNTNPNMKDSFMRNQQYQNENRKENINNYSGKTLPLLTLEAKDDLINQLKTEIYGLQQDKKSFSCLENKYKNLLSNYSQANADANAKEYDHKKEIDTLNSKIYSLNMDNEDMAIDIKNLKATNKQVFNDNVNLCNLIEIKNNEIENLKKIIKEKDDLISKFKKDKEQSDNLISKLTAEKNQNDMKIEKMKHEQLANCIRNQDAEDHINSMNTEFTKTRNELEKNKLDLKDLQTKLELTESKLRNTTSELEHANQIIMQLDQSIRAKDEEIKKNQIEHNGLLEQLKSKEKDNQDLTSKKCEEYEENILKLQAQLKKSESDKGQLIYEKERIIHEKAGSERDIE
ncbi:MAG: hypothetical protein MJ252_22180, partial [archaeon]|nr:hypothetical protein [archaeon]